MTFAASLEINAMYRITDLERAIHEWEQGNYASCFPIIEYFAKKDNNRAQFVLASAYSTSDWGKDRDMDEAVKWYKLAMKNGHPHAAIYLAMIFDPTTLLGSDNKDKSLAEYYYQLAFDTYWEGALAGDAELMHGLSICYLNGFGVEMDEKKGIEWKVKSCKAGYELACSELRGRQD